MDADPPHTGVKIPRLITDSGRKPVGILVRIQREPFPMPRSSTTGLPFLVRRTDTGKFCYHRDVPATLAIFVTGEVELP